MQMVTAADTMLMQRPANLEEGGIELVRDAGGCGYLVLPGAVGDEAPRVLICDHFLACEQAQALNEGALHLQAAKQCQTSPLAQTESPGTE